MVTIEEVNERKEKAVETLTQILKEWTPSLYKESASTCFIKKYNRYLQNRDNLKKMVISAINYEYISKQLEPLEKELKLTNRKLKKEKEAAQ